MRKTAIFAAVVAWLLVFVANAETCTPTNIVVAPLTDAHWTQNAPYNEYSPLNDKGANWAAGCVAIAAAQELLVWQWPWRFGAVHEASHIVAGSDNVTIRFDGTVPFEWDALKGSYSSSDSLVSRHAAARLALFCQSLVQMQFVSSGGEAKKGIDGTMEWYEYDGNVTPSSGDAALAKILADLEFGSPLQVGVNVGGYGGHEVVGVGYGTGTNATGETVQLLGLNMGWGGAVQWWNLASTSGSYIKSAKVGFRPIKSVQIEPLAPVSGETVTINWHLPNCYTNKISGFTVAKMRLSDSATTWTDDFSNSSGRTSNSQTMRVKGGALYAWDGTSSAIYTYDEKFKLTSNSKVTYDIGSAYMSGMDARIEAKFGDGEWQTVHRFAINGGKGDGQYYNWGTMATGQTASLGGYAGKIAQFRIAVEYTKGGVYYSSDANMKIDNLSLSDVLPYEEDGEPLEVSSDLRSATFSDLESGVKYAFSVTPVMIDGSKAITQRATTTIGSPAAMPEDIQISAVVNGIEMLQEGFYLECGNGTTTFTVTSANATELKALPSHLSILPDNAVSVSGNAGVFTVTVDGSKLSSRWEGAKTILTLKASNGDGAVAAKDMVLKFNRNVVMGARTYALVSDTNATVAVEFTGGTTINGNGHTLTIKAGAFTGTGDVTLSNGTFIFEDLGDFEGTIHFGAGANITLPSDMSNFRGGISIDVGDYVLSSDMPPTSTVYLPIGHRLFPNNVNVQAKLVGQGGVIIESGSSFLGDVGDFAGTVDVGSETGTGTLTIRAGEEKSVSVWDGTLKLVLDDEQVAYGYAVAGVSLDYLGKLQFVTVSGTVLLTYDYSSASPYSWASNENVWSTASGYNQGRYSTATLWSKQVVPSSNEYVTFDSGVGSYIYIDNDSDIRLAGVRAKGTGRLTVSQLSSGSVVCSDSFSNSVAVTFSTSRFQPSVFYPGAEISIDSGACLTGMVAYDSKDRFTLSHFQDSTRWRGTVVITGADNHITVDNLGNALSFIRMNGNTGSLYWGDVSHVPIELVDPDDGVAFDWNDGYGGKTNFVGKIFGNGSLMVRGTTTSVSEKVVIRDMGEFFGNLELSAKTLVLGTAVPTTTTSDGRLHLCAGYGATVESGKTWKIGGGVYLDGSQTLDVKGVLDTTQIFANAANPLLRLSDGGLIEVDTIPSASQRINVNLYAGTFRIDGDATVSDGFCFSSTNDTYTTIDVNGHNLTFAAGAISGHGKVYLTSSSQSAKGSVVFADMGFFTGTLILDGTTNVTLPDDLSGFEGTIVVDGAEWEFNANQVPNVTVRSGGIVKVALSAGQISGGYSTNKIVLDDSAILEFVDGEGQAVAVFSLSDASGGAYTLEAQSHDIIYDDTTAMTMTELNDKVAAAADNELRFTSNPVVTFDVEPSDDAKAYLRSDNWSGTVLIKDKDKNNIDPTAYGNANSTLKLSGVKGFFYHARNDTNRQYANTVTPVIELENSTAAGREYGFYENNGYSFPGTSNQFFVNTPELKGSGTLKCDSSGASSTINTLLIVDKWDNFSGKLELSASTVWFGTGKPAVDGTDDNLIIAGTVRLGESIPSNYGTWTVANGYYGTIDVAADATAGASALFTTNIWHGTVVVPDATNNTDGNIHVHIENLGNSGSVVQLNGLKSGTKDYYINGGDVAFDTTVDINGDVHINNGSSLKTITFNEMTCTNAKAKLTLYFPNYYNSPLTNVVTTLNKYAGTLTVSNNMVFVIGTINLAVAPSEGDKIVKFESSILDNIILDSTKISVNGTVDNTGLVLEKRADGIYIVDSAMPPEDVATLSIGAGVTWSFAAGTTRTYTNVGTLSTGGTIAVTNASELAEGSYMLATWTTPQIHSTGYGRVGALDVTGLQEGLSAELIYGAKAIYLRVWNPTTQAAKGTIKLWPYGDSITEGFNLGSTKANYRVLLAQKLTLLGYNVEMVGCYDKVNGADAVDPSGVALPDKWKWHSAKHGATAGPTTNYKRGNLCENVDSLCAQVGTPDAVLLHIGVNDLAESSQDQNTTFVSWSNVVSRLVKDLLDTKIVVSTALRQLEPYRSNTEIDEYNILIRNLIANMPADWNGHVYFADLATNVDSQATGILYEGDGDNLHPDWWGHDQMAEGWLSVITNQFTSTQVFPSAAIPGAPTADELGAAAKSELSEYRKGYQLCRRIDAASNINTTNPYAATGDGATNDIEKVAYFVEYVRADNNAHKWVWVDMDTFGTTIDDVGLPTTNHQQVVTRLHVKSNHNGIDDVAVDDDSVAGFVEFSPYNYSGVESGVNGAPAGNSTSCDWNDTLYSSGSYACMQVHRIDPALPADRKGQVLFAYNNWRTGASEAEFGIGNLSQHFYTTGSEMSTIDWTFTKGLVKLNASAYSVKRIEIWTKAAEVAPVVAQIGDESYASLAEALQTVTGDDPVAITLVSASGENVTLPSNVTVTENSAGLYTGTLSGSGTFVLSATRSSSLSFGTWTGTVVLPSSLANIGGNFHFNYYGKEGSTVRLASNLSGWIQREDSSQPAVINPAIEIPEGNKLTISDYSSSFRYALRVLKGYGDFEITFDGDLLINDASYSPYFRIGDISEFRGKISTAKPTLVLGTMTLPTKPANNTPEADYACRILVYAPVTAYDDWSATNGIVLADAAATLTVGIGVSVTTDPAISTSVANSRVKATGTNPVVYSVIEFIPVLPYETPEAVAAAIGDASFADTAVATVINGSDDPVAEYKAFKSWAGTIEGGEEAVVANQHAAAAYVLGATTLFESKPTVEISEAELNTTTGAMALTVVVKDGETLKTVSSAKVKYLFEATSDLSDWIGKMLEPTVTDHTEGQSHTLQFTVKPGDGTSPKAFLRIRK